MPACERLLRQVAVLKHTFEALANDGEVHIGTVYSNILLFMQQTHVRNKFLDCLRILHTTWREQERQPDT
jgi:hypothetical protein